MWSKLFPKRFSLLKSFVIIFLSFSFLVRLSFLLWDFREVDSSVFNIIKTFVIGLFFDIGTVSYFTIPYLIFLIFFPVKWYGNLVDRIFSYFGFSLGVLIIYFSFFGEFTFWEEFQRRYNFIAVDYLIYTYEVVKNINESYPLPILIGSLLILVFLSVFSTIKLGFFQLTFKN